MNERKDVDWEAIRMAYRCHTPGNRLLADMHGISEGAIRARAKREGWQRDLAAACRAEVQRQLAVMPRRDQACIRFIPWYIDGMFRETNRRIVDAEIAKFREWREPCTLVDGFGRTIGAGWKPSKRDRDRCGARTRAGGICKAPAMWLKERCRMHGGLSTGPRTPEGKARSLAAAREGYRRWRAEQRAAAHTPE
jgi:hypothetical protein